MKVKSVFKKRLGGLVLMCLVLSAKCFFALANEVIPQTSAEVVVREHPQTGIPYVSIVDPRKPEGLLSGEMKKYNRPDYRMLDPKVKPRDTHYDGPVSDRKKIYILAGALAAGGIAGYAAMPVAAAGGGAATGAGAYAAASAAVTAGTFSTHWAMRHDDRPDDFTQTSVSRELKL
jgi:hypothetical protein